MSPSGAPRRALRPVPTPEPESATVAFCGHCGARPELAQQGSPPATRVCQSCQMGLLLRASREAAPAAEQAFMVIDDSLKVCALSARAEKLLDTTETQAIHRPLADFLVPADAEAKGCQNLMESIVAAASGHESTCTIVVRPSGEFGVRHWVRVAACGPPSAALLLFADA